MINGIARRDFAYRRMRPKEAQASTDSLRFTTLDIMNDENDAKAQEKTPGCSNSTATKETKKSLFNHLNADLRNALDTWEVLTEEMAQKISPEEKQLSEVKKLLGELKSKLAEFGD